MADERVTALGYEFACLDDAILAQSEIKKIDYLKAHLDRGDADTVKALYDKAIDEKFFKTPVGIGFLTEMREYLIETLDYSEEEVRAIPLYMFYDTTKKKAPEKPVKKKEHAGVLFTSIVLNIALIVAVIIMFWIATHTDHPNILNYETVLTDKYATWEQELTERETAVRQAERELEFLESGE
ncbi:MAG: hypothetical protein J6I66_10555 [Lachnospiraceae bacterium]|nr:hypothetical protein [Lachnospiraceae bacterium]MBP3755286.1 hypothetical protein [Lachnospiraceae bacterium]